MTPNASTGLQPYDFEAAEIRQAGLVLAGQAETLVITNDETDLAAKTVLAFVAKGLKAAKTRHDEVKEKPLAECNAIDAAFRDAYEPFQAAKKTIGAKTGAYYKLKLAAEEAVRREAERLEREAITARAKAEAEAAAAEARGEEPAPQPEAAAPLPAIPHAEAVTRTEVGSVGMVRTRGFQVVDQKQIPREFFLLDVKRIAAIYKSGGGVLGCVEDITYSPRTH